MDEDEKQCLIKSCLFENQIPCQHYIKISFFRQFKRPKCVFNFTRIRYYLAIVSYPPFWTPAYIIILKSRVYCMFFIVCIYYVCDKNKKGHKYFVRGRWSRYDPVRLLSICLAVRIASWVVSLVHIKKKMKVILYATFMANEKRRPKRVLVMDTRSHRSDIPCLN